MSLLKLPKKHRPNGYYRPVDLGSEIPTWFYDNLRAIDPKLYIVFHKYRTLWDPIINEYEGELDNPRYTIKESHGYLNFGFVLTDNKYQPIHENKCHIWRLCPPYGWAHIIPLESTSDSMYLRLVLKRLDLQAKWTERYGFRSYNKLLEELDEKKKEQLIKDREEMFNLTLEENQHFMKRAMDNFSRGISDPTNPNKESIVSYAGQTNRSRIVRPLEDREGLIIPE